MASIDQFRFTVFGIRLIDAGEEAEVITRPGVDGEALLIDAWRADPCTGPTIALLGVGEDATGLIEGYRALHNEEVTVVDQFSRTWKCKVKSVKAWPAIDALGRTIVSAQWSLIPKAIRPW